MSSSVYNQGIPPPSVPVIDITTGMISVPWWRFFLSMFQRTGGSIGVAGFPGGANGDVQYNAGGGFGGLTDAQLTTRIQTFTSTLGGSVPASGGGSTTFLRADATFGTPAVSGSASGDLSGTYPGPTVVKVDGVSYPASPSTNTVPVVTGTNTVTYETVPVAAGGTGITKGTSGGVLGFTGTGTIASSALLTDHALMLGGGATATPTTLASLGTTTTVLHGNKSGDPSFSAVDLTADVTDVLPVLNGGTGTTTSTGTAGDTVLSKNPTLAGVTVQGNGKFALTSQTDGSGALVGTLKNAPSTGDPSFWLQISINGATRYVPAWT